MGIRFEGTTKNPKDKKETQLFSIEEILWDSAIPKGKQPSRRNGTANGNGTDLEGRKLRPISTGAANTFLFAIKWPYINYPPTIPAHRSVVQTEYVLRGFVHLSNKTEDCLSEPVHVEYRPRIDPTQAYKHTPHEKSETTIKDENGKLVADASLTCTTTSGTIFGADCAVTLGLLVRQSDAKYLPRKAKIEIYEIHKNISSNAEQRFLLSQENVALPPEMIKSHRECNIPLKIHIPVPEIDIPRGAMGLPTLDISALQVKYVLRVIVPLTSSRFVPSSKLIKTVSVEYPIAVGNAKGKGHEETLVPRLVVNSEGEGIWKSNRIGEQSKEIVDWQVGCEIPRFLPSGDVEEDDIV